MVKSFDSFKNPVAMQDVSSYHLPLTECTITEQVEYKQSETKYSFQIQRPAAAASSPARRCWVLQIQNTKENKENAKHK